MTGIEVHLYWCFVGRREEGGNPHRVERAVMRRARSQSSINLIHLKECWDQNG